MNFRIENQTFWSHFYAIHPSLSSFWLSFSQIMACTQVVIGHVSSKYHFGHPPFSQWRFQHSICIGCQMIWKLLKLTIRSSSYSCKSLFSFAGFLVSTAFLNTFLSNISYGKSTNKIKFNIKLLGMVFWVPYLTESFHKAGTIGKENGPGWVVTLAVPFGFVYLWLKLQD